ncbi:type II secretion system F family protein [Butyrivibrio sp. MC2021]|uniref:type II secretion system F family protein n=1 Tax=Butyrivibrio sp. MC2021 TaxID=1408306 RepID=UPI00047EF812|nr:type II secretion system F family protein [Butyrivibrio sp. MC2021]
MITILYGAVPALSVALWFLARKTTLPEEIDETGISRELLRMSLFLYKKLVGSKKFRFLEPEAVRTNLRQLNNPRDMGSLQTGYYIRKLSLVLLLANAGSILALLMHLSVVFSSNIDDEGRLLRRDYGEGSYDAELIAESPGGEVIGEFSLPVDERRYTASQAKNLFEEASEILPGAILGGNPSLDEVTEDLNLVEVLEGYPFEIDWTVEDYSVMHYDGSLNTEAIPAGGKPVMLTATFSYGDDAFQQVLYANVKPKTLTPYEQLMESINGKLKDADKESQYDESIPLPGSYGETEIIWKENTQDNSLMLLIMMLVLSVGSYVIKDRELSKQVRERSKALLSEYPQFVSKMVLYLGAGMTMRGAIEKQARNYQQKKRAGAPKSYLYEEILRSARELKSGVPETKVYESLGQRCGSQQYTRLCTLLSQNLKKGNSELLTLLRSEAEKAFSDRLDLVRKEGEEAGTRLLMPMVLMLLIVMVIIMIPAYMAF